MIPLTRAKAINALSELIGWGEAMRLMHDLTRQINDGGPRVLERHGYRLEWLESPKNRYIVQSLAPLN
jgi:hypothetical protein